MFPFASSNVQTFSRTHFTTWHLVGHYHEKFTFQSNLHNNNDPSVTKLNKQNYLRARSFPRPRNGVQFVGIADANGLDGHAGIESARLERDQTRAVRARAFREDQDLGPVQVGGGTLYYLFDRVLARVRIVAPHINWLSEVYQFYMENLLY